MLLQVGVSFELYYDARRHKIKIQILMLLTNLIFTTDNVSVHTIHSYTPTTNINNIFKFRAATRYESYQVKSIHLPVMAYSDQALQCRGF